MNLRETASAAQPRRAARRKGCPPRVYTATEVLEHSSAYPRMVIGACYESAAILSGLWPELRYFEGTRTVEFLSPAFTAAEKSVIEHGWNELADGTVIDSAAYDCGLTDRDHYHHYIRVTYAEQPVPGNDGDVQGLIQSVRQRTPQRPTQEHLRALAAQFASVVRADMRRAGLADAIARNP